MLVGRALLTWRYCGVCPLQMSSRNSHRSSSSSRRSSRDSQSRRGPQSAVDRGLAYLRKLDSLVIHQEVQPLAVFTGWETGNRYTIFNSARQPIFYAVEQSNILTTNFVGRDRPFEIVVLDTSGQQVLRMHRPFKLRICWSEQEISVYGGDGRVLGTVLEDFRFCAPPRFQIVDSRGRGALWLEGPCCESACMDTNFYVLSADKSTTVGTITRHFPGFFQQAFTYADVFGVQFPVDLTVQLKAVLLAATFLIDFMFYEKPVGEMAQRMHHRY